MSKITMIDGDLVDYAKANRFGVVAHIMNCYSDYGGNLARRMTTAFGINKFSLEQPQFKGDYDKLGRIESRVISDYGDPIYVVNMYAVYHSIDAGTYGIPLDYDALVLCLRKLNKKFEGGEIAIPRLGTGKGSRGDWETIEKIITDELVDAHGVVILNKKTEARLERQDDESIHVTT